LKHFSKANSNRAIEFAIGAFFSGYLLYVLMLGKLFSLSIHPDWFRDMGLHWAFADYVFEYHRYQIGDFFSPPPSAILIHLFGRIDHEVAFRVFLILQAASFAITLWAWSILIGISKQPNRMLIVFVAFLAGSFYVHFEFAMHNLNLITLGLLSIALVLERHTILSTACFSLSVAIKPYGNVLILPWMAWRSHPRWVLSALLGLVLLFAVLPALWFGSAVTWQLYKDWLASLFAAINRTDGGQISMRAGIATVLQFAISDPLVERISWALHAIYLAAVAAFFLPTLFRRVVVSGLPMASEVAALLLVPLPVGGHQQPARGVVLLVAMLVMASALFDKRRTAHSRIILAGILAAIGISTHVVSVGPLHFLLTLPVCLATLIGLAIARRAPGGGSR